MHHSFDCRFVVMQASVCHNDVRCNRVWPSPVDWQLGSEDVVEGGVEVALSPEGCRVRSESAGSPLSTLSVPRPGRRWGETWDSQQAELISCAGSCPGQAWGTRGIGPRGSSRQRWSWVMGNALMPFSAVSLHALHAFLRVSEDQARI